MNVVSLSRYAFGGYMLPCTNVITLVNVGHGFLVCTRIVYGSTICAMTTWPAGAADAPRGTRSVRARATRVWRRVIERLLLRGRSISVEFRKIHRSNSR